MISWFYEESYVPVKEEWIKIGEMWLEDRIVKIEITRKTQKNLFQKYLNAQDIFPDFFWKNHYTSSL